MRNTTVRMIALGGVLAAVAGVVFCLGGMIPVATYVCPAICMMICRLVVQLCGKRLAWAWYGTVALLAVLVCPDKEGAAVFVLLGFYPILKVWFDRLPASLLWKLLYFNLSVILLYSVGIRVLGMHQVLQEYRELGTAGLGILLLLGNVVFFLLDRLLGMKLGRKGRKHG